MFSHMTVHFYQYKQVVKMKGSKFSTYAWDNGRAWDSHTVVNRRRPRDKWASGRYPHSTHDEGRGSPCCADTRPVIDLLSYYHPSMFIVSAQVAGEELSTAWLQIVSWTLHKYVTLTQISCESANAVAESKISCFDITSNSNQNLFQTCQCLK